MQDNFAPNFKAISDHYEASEVSDLALIDQTERQIARFTRDLKNPIILIHSIKIGTSLATILNPKVITLHVRHFTTYQAHFLCHIKMTTLLSMTIAKYYTGQLICLMSVAILMNNYPHL